jgi:hypothetical protein
MPAYDSTLFNPPAPLARVELRNQENGIVLSDVPMLIDSGADVTLIPQTAADTLQLAIIPGSQYELAGFDGNASFAPVVTVELFFCRRTFRGQFLLIDQQWGILGRNVLNVIPLLFDGPRLRWDEYIKGV